jgi:hypothetical protein
MTSLAGDEVFNTIAAEGVFNARSPLAGSKA